MSKGQRSFIVVLCVGLVIFIGERTYRVLEAWRSLKQVPTASPEAAKQQTERIRQTLPTPPVTGARKYVVRDTTAGFEVTSPVPMALDQGRAAMMGSGGARMISYAGSDARTGLQYCVMALLVPIGTTYDLDRGAQGVIRGAGMTLDSTENFVFAGRYPARELWGSQATDKRMIVRMMFVNGVAYGVMVAGPDSSIQGTDAAQFLDSLRMTTGLR